MKSKAVTYLTKLLVLLKNWTFVLFATLADFLLPLSPLIIVSVILAIFDWVLKLYCVYKLEGKSGIKSNKMQDTFYKIIIYALFLIVLFTVDQLFIKTALYDLFALFMDETYAMYMTKIQLSTIGTFMIIARESKSFDENWEAAFGFSPISYAIDLFNTVRSWKIKP